MRVTFRRRAGVLFVATSCGVVAGLVATYLIGNYWRGRTVVVHTDDGTRSVERPASSHRRARAASVGRLETSRPDHWRIPVGLEASVMRHLDQHRSLVDRWSAGRSDEYVVQSPDWWLPSEATARAEATRSLIEEECGCDGTIVMVDCVSFPCIYVTNEPVDPNNLNAWTVQACVSACGALPQGTHVDPGDAFTLLLPGTVRSDRLQDRVGVMLAPMNDAEAGWYDSESERIGDPRTSRLATLLARLASTLTVQ